MICNTLLGVDKHFFSSVSFWQLVAKIANCWFFCMISQCNQIFFVILHVYTIYIKTVFLIYGI